MARRGIAGDLVVGANAFGQGFVRVDVNELSQDGGARARRIRNLTPTTEGDLRSARGPTPLEMDRGEGYFSFGRIHGIFHCNHLGGKVGHTYVRAGTKLYRHAGWARSWEEIYSGLSDDHTPRAPDQWAIINDMVIWSNGIDQPLRIHRNGKVQPLGFGTVPSAPRAEGPRSPSTGNTAQIYTGGRGSYHENSLAYSWRGVVGTIGEYLDARDAVLREGLWVWAAQFEDDYGDLSAMSLLSNPVTLTTQATKLAVWTGGKTEYCEADQIEDLTRQFAVFATGRPPSHGRYVRLYRSVDRKNNGDLQLRLVARIPGRRFFVYPDNVPDAELGGAATSVIPVPTFHAMCTYGGRLVVADGPRVLISQPGFPGTFVVQVYPDAGGAAITAVADHAGRLLAFTEFAVYDITQLDQPPVPLAQGIGCVAMDSLRALPSGNLVWLSYSGFYALGVEGPPRPISNEISGLIETRLPKSALCQASATVAPEVGEYRCAVTPAGSHDNAMILALNDKGWREYVFGVSFIALTTTKDPRLYCVAGVYEPSEARYNVMVMDREDTSYDPPLRDSVYAGPRIRFDEIGVREATVEQVVFIFVDERSGPGTAADLDDDAGIVARFYINGDYDNAIGDAVTLRGVGRDDGSGVGDDLLGKLTVGEGKVHAARTYARAVFTSLFLQNVRDWSFTLTCTEPSRMRLVAFAFLPTTPAGDRAALTHVAGPTDF